ncbi:isocitrate lyase/PEP mutase family protein [Pseudooceanicola nanhaiensis]|uniref:isocitrate lyase/PEP mutase family protein n=1 Tax=Pseudooceanicola nanhaiensis TaxID=375761 RepID=UPI001CD56199|nr:isocitrate lyase/PEP mutase family protein [Pseudooceanicola nanhaiensis]MCA0918779.1 isocitrate lyase/PEP mutase family protein [Pseudooceanicola nanhaiensis]
MSTPSTRARTAKLREMINGDKPLPMGGTFDGVSAKLAEAAGFPIIYASGFGISASRLGMPDVGYLTMPENVEMVSRICDAVSAPVVADGDTCYGNYMNATRLIRDVEKAGASGMHIEDQMFPKRCGHMAGKRLGPAKEMCDKIKAICDARSDDNFVLIARTDAIATDGFEAACERAHMYVEAGADVIFIEAPVDDWQMNEIPRRFDVPLMYNASWDGLSPVPQLEDLSKLGYRILSYPDSIMAAAGGLAHMYRSILQGGNYPDDGMMMRFGAFNTMIGLPEVDALNDKYELPD